MTGSELKRRREALGLTQAALARAFGDRCTQQTVNRWEAGSQAITPARAFWIEQKLREIEARQPA